MDQLSLGKKQSITSLQIFMQAGALSLYFVREPLIAVSINSKLCALLPSEPPSNSQQTLKPFEQF
jgi:hypothetical protein